MNLPNPVLIPLLNPNEPVATLSSIHVREGQHVSPGDLLCTLETTKSSADVTSEYDGYVSGLRFQVGETVHAGDVLCYLPQTSIEQPTPANSPAGIPQPIGGEGPVPEGLRITQPALALARLYGLELGRLPAGPLVTESLVRSMLEGLTRAPGTGPDRETPEKRSNLSDFTPQTALPAAPFDSAAILIYGGGGHGKMVIDLLRGLPAYRIAGLVDDGRAPGEQVMGLPVTGGAEVLSRLHNEGVRLAANAVGGIGNILVRIKIFQRLAEAGFACPALVHPAAVVERSATLAQGAQVFANAYLGSDARVGYGCIINTGAILSHDCRIGDYTNISPGAILAGEVHVGDGALVGMGVTVNLGVKIGPGARIGNGATVISDVPEGGVVRAGTIWRKGI